MNQYNSNIMKEYLITKSVTCSLKTLLNYERNLTYFFNNVQKDIREIKSEDITKWVCDNLELLSPSSVLAYYKTVNTFFNFCVTKEYLNKSPFNPRWHRPKIEKAISKALDIEDIIEIKIVIENWEIRDRTLLELLQCTGLRKNEVKSLNIGDINLQERTINVIGKGNKPRVVFFTKKCGLLLEKLIVNRSEDEPIFLSMTSGKSYKKRLGVSGIAEVVKKLQKDVTLKRSLTPHVFRHNFATELYRQGVDIKEIKELMGQVKKEDTMGYINCFLGEAMSEYHRAMD